MASLQITHLTSDLLLRKQPDCVAELLEQPHLLKVPTTVLSGLFPSLLKEPGTHDQEAVFLSCGSIRMGGFPEQRVC